MPASDSASFATLTTRLSTVSASNFPNGVCAHPTMLAVMVISLGTWVRCSLFRDRFQRFHASLADGSYAGPVSGPDLGRRTEPGTTDGDHIGFGQPGGGVGLADAAGRTEPRLRKRASERAKCLDTAGGLGREEFHEIEAVRERGHQLGGAGDPRRERQCAGGRGLQ